MISRVKQYINTKAPQFRFLLQCKLKEMSNFDPNLTDQELDLELYKLKLGFEEKLENDYQKLMNWSV